MAAWKKDTWGGRGIMNQRDGGEGAETLWRRREPRIQEAVKAENTEASGSE